MTIVTNAASCVAGFEKRDSLIRQCNASRKLMKKFCTKGQFMLKKFLASLFGNTQGSRFHCNVVTFLEVFFDF